MIPPALQSSSPPVLRDGFGRAIDYLRLSVTDRCNLRCVYCLPEFYQGFTPTPEVLTDDEVIELATAFVDLGFSKIRITGGEPLARPGLPGLIKRLAALNGVKDLSLSTNGALLPPLIRDLARAGLKRVNISLDSLKADRFARITRVGRVENVLAGIDQAVALGLSPVKINVVVARGMNEDEMADFVRLTEDRPIHVRFIELMPMGETGFFTRERHVPLEEMLERAAPLESLPLHEWPRGNGPARYYRRPGARGTVGFISAISCGFCQACNRVRLSSKGVLVPCLDGADGADLRSPLRAGAGRPAVQDLIRQTIARKPEKHSMAERATPPAGRSPSAPPAGSVGKAAGERPAGGGASSPRFMCQIGG